MVFRQILDDDLGCASYFLAGSTGAVVVDPARRIDRYLELAERHGVRIVHVLDTHVHADHVSGRERLAEVTGATSFVPLPGAARLDGGALILGDVRIEVIDTGGHRPDHVSYLVTDLSLSEQPCLLLTGDSLLVGDVARPDLATSDTAETREAGRRLYRSLRRLAALPDHVEIWPGHVAGSLCGAAHVVDRVSSTIGFERLGNAAFAAWDEDAFVDGLVERLPTRPPTVELVVALNRWRGSGAGGGTPRRLAPERVARLLERGAAVIDGRTARDFDEGSILGSLSIPLEQSGVGTRAAWAADPLSPVVAVAADELEAIELAARLEAVGFVDLRGVLAGGVDAWIAERRPVRETRQLRVEEVAELVRAGSVTLVDLRDDAEHQRVHVPDSLHIPWQELRRRAPEAFAPGRAVVVACASGRRTPLGASLLAREGRTTVGRVFERGIAELAEVLGVGALAGA